MLLDAALQVGDTHGYLQRWIQPRVNRLAGLSIDARETYQAIYLDDVGDDFRSNTWLREIYDEASVFWRDNPHAVDIAEVADSLAIKFGQIVSLARAGLMPWSTCEVTAKKILDSMSLSLPQGDSLSTSLARLEDAKWWRCAFSKSLPRIVDQACRRHGVVHKQSDIYLSDTALAYHRKRVEGNRSVLEGLEAVSELGDRLLLSEVAERSLAKAANRRTEYMVRSRGMEEYSATQDYRAMFVTLTTPSKYHCRLASGLANPSWNGSTPREAQAYLMTVWKRTRASLKRRGVDYFGVRIAEPHHDGTPHWHLLIYVALDDYTELEDAFRRYAMEEDGLEPGASQHRFRVLRIDPAKGTPTGYVAKYISKGLDGYGMDQDFYGNPSAMTAERIVAWARIWGIRQFQTFGTPPVGVYRELRRVREPTLPLYESARLAADAADYCCVLQQSEALGLRTFRSPWLDAITGECSSPLDQYGDLKPDPVRGIEANGVVGAERLFTRTVQWVIQRRDEIATPWTCVNNCTGEEESVDPFYLMPVRKNQSPGINTNSSTGPPIKSIC